MDMDPTTFSLYSPREQNIIVQINQKIEQMKGFKCHWCNHTSRSRDEFIFTIMDEGTENYMATVMVTTGCIKCRVATFEACEPQAIDKKEIAKEKKRLAKCGGELLLGPPGAISIESI